jgi:hypothetical protein
MDIVTSSGIEIPTGPDLFNAHWRFGDLVFGHTERCEISWVNVG